jgi:DNA-binding transcriptional ArsR family regulator
VENVIVRKEIGLSHIQGSAIPRRRTMQNDALQVWKAEFFKALAHPARIRILEHLRNGEQPAGEILEALGLEQSNGSQHLAVLRNKDILIARREGTSVLYSVRDPMLYEILDLLRQYFYEHLTEIRGLLEALDSSPPLVTSGAPVETG